MAHRAPALCDPWFTSPRWVASSWDIVVGCTVGEDHYGTSWQVKLTTELHGKLSSPWNIMAIKLTTEHHGQLSSPLTMEVRLRSLLTIVVAYKSLCDIMATWKPPVTTVTCWRLGYHHVPSCAWRLGHQTASWQAENKNAKKPKKKPRTTRGPTCTYEGGAGGGRKAASTRAS